MPLKMINGNTSSSSSSDELLQAQAHVWNQMFAFERSMSLKCAIELNIPDIIHRHGKPMSLSLLSKTLKLDAHKSQCLSRIMRLLVHAKFFTIISSHEEEEEEEACYYSLTTASRLLLKDEPMSVFPLVEVVLDPVITKPWEHVGEWLLIGDKVDERHNNSPFETSHGVSIWDSAFSKDSRLTQLFYDAMARDSVLAGRVLVRNFGEYFQGIDTLVDVAGGTGNMAKAIADAFPSVRCTVLDLPHVVDGLKCNQNSCNGNLRYVGGDMFEMIPPADVLLLKWVLHDWDDESCLKILKKCKESLLINNGGRLLVIDMVVGNGVDDDVAAYYEAQVNFDMAMMTYINGKERTEKEWAKLFSDAGFGDFKVVLGAFGTRSLIEVYP